MGNEITQQHLSQLQMQLPLNSTAESLCTTRRMQMKRHTVTKTWWHGGKPQIKLSAGEITIANIKIIIKPVNEATRWVLMTSILIVGRCLLLPSFRRETEGTDCTWIRLPSNYDPRRTRKSTTRRWRTARRPSTRRRFTSNQCMVPIEQSYDVKDHYCNAHYQIASRKQTSLCYWINMLLCVYMCCKREQSNKCFDKLFSVRFWNLLQY